MIYCGQEVGNEKSIDFFERDPISWKESEFWEFYKKLCWVYRDHPALYKGEITKLKSDNEHNIYSFFRHFRNDTVVVVVNFSSEEFDGQIYFEQVSGSFHDIFSGENLLISNESLRFALHPWSYRVLIH